MFTFRDFFHLPQLDPLVDQIVAERSGLIVVAGIDSHALELNDAGAAFTGEGQVRLELPTPGAGAMKPCCLAVWPRSLTS